MSILVKYYVNFNLIRVPTKSDYNLLFVIGRGGFGRVWRAESKKNKQ